MLNMKIFFINNHAWKFLKNMFQVTKVLSFIAQNSQTSLAV